MTVRPPVPPLQLVACSLSACMDRAIVCCLAQVKESSRKEAAFRRRKVIVLIVATDARLWFKFQVSNLKARDFTPVETHAHIRLLLVPPNVTAVCQPLHRAYMRPLTAGAHPTLVRKSKTIPTSVPTSPTALVACGASSRAGPMTRCGTYRRCITTQELGPTSSAPMPSGQTSGKLFRHHRGHLAPELRMDADVEAIADVRGGPAHPSCDWHFASSTATACAAYAPRTERRMRREFCQVQDSVPESTGDQGRSRKPSARTLPQQLPAQTRLHPFLLSLPGSVWNLLNIVLCLYAFSARLLFSVQTLAFASSPLHGDRLISQYTLGFIQVLHLARHIGSSVQFSISL